MGDQATLEYSFDISHAVSSSSEASTCSVEPDTTEDVSKIVSYPDLTHQHWQTRVLPASYFGIDPDAICGERWRTRHESEFFVNERRSDRVVTLQ
jgi:hypothetical protein